MDFLTKKMKPNEGEVPQYYVENSHPAIISPEEFEAVQAEIKRRKTLGRRYSSQSVIAARIVCGECGDFYGSKVWHSNSKYRRTVWQCNSKFKSDSKCSTPTLDENEVKERFMTAYNSLVSNRMALIEDVRFMQNTLTDCSQLDSDISQLGEELAVVTELMRKCIAKNATSAIDQTEYAEQYQSLMARYDKTAERLKALEKAREDRLAKATSIGGFLFELMERDEPLVEFDDKLWLVSIEKATAFHDGRLVFTFQNGIEVTA